MYAIKVPCVIKVNFVSLKNLATNIKIRATAEAVPAVLFCMNEYLTFNV